MFRSGRIRLPFILILLSILTACGGGGSSSDSPATLLINGITVPPDPDAAVNQATLAGVDSNSNGIRDDIERQIATDFGTDAARHALATDHARLLQEVFVSPTPGSNTAYFDQFRCINDSVMLSQLDTLARLVLDTASRQRAYGTAIAGAVISIEGC